MDFIKATVEDVPEIVSKIKALRALTDTGVNTKTQQSVIFRSLPHDIFIEVACELVSESAKSAADVLAGR